jgi:hypothetical protein
MSPSSARSSARRSGRRAVRGLGRERGTLFTQDGHTRGSVQLGRAMVGVLGEDALS